VINTIKREYQLKNILVTGATSQIGKFLLPLLSKDKFKIYAISRKRIIDDTDINWLNIDICNDEIPNLAIDTIIHLAEITYIDKIVKQLNNIKRVIAFSSTSVLTKINSSSLEDRQLALHLKSSEDSFIYICNVQNIKWTIFRPTLIYGANMDKNITFISNFINKYSFFPILGNGAGLRQPVHSYDLALAIINCINNKKSFNKIYNLTGAETLSYINMVERIFLSLNQKKRLIKVPKILFSFLIRLVRIFPSYRHLTTGMVDRLNEDLCFSTKEAQNDFGYSPHQFIPNKDILK
jgi:nucleoside-diphosphate-sugar epimerase